MIWAAITANLWRAACAALVGVCAVLWVQLHGLPLIGGGALAELRIAQTTITNIRNAQDHATAAQVAVNHEPAYKSAAIAKVNNVQSAEYSDRVRRAAVDSVRAKAVACPSSPANLPRADSPAKVDDGDASASGMVSVASDEWLQFTQAAGQTVMCVTAGRALIDAGIAVEGIE